MTHGSHISRAVRLALASAGVLSTALCVPAVHAQDGAGAESLEEITVVGSRIRRGVEVAGPSPVVTIDADSLERSGYANVQDALNNISQNAGGALDQQQTFGFTPSASAIDLRGFGVGRSLVLLDGRRLPVFPIAAGGTTNFIDLSSIPTGAIQRVEVLTDGASAIYGSDAIGGVVNIVTKKDVEPSASIRFGDTTQGGGQQQRYQLTGGLTDESGGRAVFLLEHFQQDPIMFTDRDYSASDRLGGVNGTGPGIFSGYGAPGTFFNEDAGAQVAAPNCASPGGPGITGGICRFNRAAFRQLFPDIQRSSVMASYERPLGDAGMEFFSRAIYATSRTQVQIEAAAFDQIDDVGYLTPAGAAANPTSPGATPGYTGPAVDGFYRRRLTEWGPRRERTRNDTLNVLAGVRGKFAAYDWELGAQWAEQRVDSLNTGYAKKDALGRLVAGQDPDGDFIGDGGTLNLFLPVPQSVVDATSIQPRTDGLSQVATVDFQLTGDLFEIWGGRMLKFAGVAEYTRQRFYDRRDPETLAGNVIALGGTSGGGDRRYGALGLELQVPVFDELNVNFAGRYDNYDDDSNVGGAFSPRVAVEYRPFEKLLVRATYGRSFRAPDLQRLFGAETTGFEDLIDTPLCIQRGGTGRGDTSVAECVEPANSIETREGANIDLVEEEGENFSAGFVVEPLDRLTVSVDVFYIDLQKIVNTLDEQILLDKNAATGAYADAIQRDPRLVSPQNPGGLLLVSSQARNLSFQRMSGVDVASQYQLPTALGDWSFGVSGTYLNSLRIREALGEPVIDVLKEGVLGEYTRFRGTANVGWARGPLSANVLVNHIGRFTPFSPSANFPKVDAWTTVNLSVGYATPWNGDLLVGVNNVADEDPPLDLQNGNAGQPFYNQTFHNPYGAQWYVNYTQRF